MFPSATTFHDIKKSFNQDRTCHQSHMMAKEFEPRSSKLPRQVLVKAVLRFYISTPADGF
jgi:hypothetical protein